jgi:hypothetical protein
MKIKMNPNLYKPKASRISEYKKGRQDALKEYEEKYPNFRSIWDEAFIEGHKVTINEYYQKV